MGKIEIQEFIGENVNEFYDWFEPKARTGEIRIASSSLNNEDGIERYTLEVNDKQVAMVERIAPSPSTPEFVRLGITELK